MSAAATLICAYKFCSFSSQFEHYSLGNKRENIEDTTFILIPDYCTDEGMKGFFSRICVGTINVSRLEGVSAFQSITIMSPT